MQQTKFRILGHNIKIDTSQIPPPPPPTPGHRHLSLFKFFGSWRPCRSSGQGLFWDGTAAVQGHVAFPKPPPSCRGTPCNSPELSLFGSERLGEAGQKITCCLKSPILPHQIRQREEDGALRGGRRTSGRRRGVSPSHTAHPWDPSTATVREIGSVCSLVIPMADTTLAEALAREQGEMRGRHQTLRWTQPCVRQAVHREPKKWVSQTSKQPMLSYMEQ